MTGTEIRALAESYVDDRINDTDALMWLNACLNRLGIDAKSMDSVAISVVNADTWIDLPVDFLVVNEIVDAKDKQLTGYKIRNGQIKISTAGNFTMWYWKKPTIMTSLSETPNTHILLHSPAALFVAAQFKFKDDDENPDALRLMNFFEIEKKQALWQIDTTSQDGSAVIKVVD